MQAEYERKYHELEKKHYWFRSRRKYIHQLLKSYPKDSKILDIGCSSGVLLEELLQSGYSADNLYGVDISKKAIKLCKEHGIVNSYQMDAQHITINQKFNIIIASDCLEHLEDDNMALQNWLELLEPDGVVLIFVPAHMALWSKHDEVNMHYRRYSKKELLRKFKNNGFDVTRSSYWNFSLFTPVLLYRVLSNIFKNNDNGEKGDIEGISVFNSLLYFIISAENKFLQVINLPIGISLFGILKKKQ